MKNKKHLDSVAALMEQFDLSSYSEDTIAQLNAAANQLSDEAALLKRAEAPRAERLAVKERIARLVIARDVVQRLRTAQPGDVVVGTATLGGQ